MLDSCRNYLYIPLSLIFRRGFYGYRRGSGRHVLDNTSIDYGAFVEKTCLLAQEDENGMFHCFEWEIRTHYVLNLVFNVFEKFNDPVTGSQDLKGCLIVTTVRGCRVSGI